MAKLKLAILIILAIFLVIFAYENSSQTLTLILFKRHLVEKVPTYLLAYGSLALGLLIGWVAHGLRIRRKRREAQVAQAPSAQQRQEPQAGQADNQAQ
ncbi:MAG: hypothetical protein ACYC6G_08630 [Desulfobaccales bacterium]